MQKEEDGLPNARRYINDVLRGGSYSFVTAIADLVDNSIEANSENIWIDVDFNSQVVMVLDDGEGMSDSIHHESMKVAAQTRTYKKSDLGRYGTGLKAASLSQCRKLTVATRSKGSDTISVRTLDIDHVNETDDWSRLILVSDVGEIPAKAANHLKANPGTVVIWESLDRVLGDNELTGSSAKEELLKQAEATEKHLRVVFHRFLDGSVPNKPLIAMFVNGAQVEPWDPFIRSESTRIVWDGELKVTDNHSVHVTSFSLPGEKEFSSKSAWFAARGPKQWNESQGFYVYRNFRLIRSGGWLRMRTSEPHRSLARVQVDFSSDLDAIFKVPVDKSSITLPKQVQFLFEPIVKEVAGVAEARYRSQKSIELYGSLSSLPTRAASANSVRRKLTATAFFIALERVAVKKSLTLELAELKKAVISEMPSIADEMGWS